MNRRDFLISSTGLVLSPSMAWGQGTATSTGLIQLLTQQFSKFGSALGVEAKELETPQVEHHGTFIIVKTDAWTYSTDISGNQTFRPSSVLAYLTIGMNGGKTRSEYALMPNENWVDNLAANAWKLAEHMHCNDKSFTKTFVKKEVLLGGACNAEAMLHTGRYLIRFCGDGDRFFDVLTDAAGKAIRLDTNLDSEQSRAVSNALFANMDRAMPSALIADGAMDMTTGTFFAEHETNAQTEWRFRSEALSFQSHQKLDPTKRANPFDRSTETSDWWSFTWWNLYGRVNGVRGNWVPSHGHWERSQGKILERSLEQYQASGEPDADSKQLDPDFYRDLETCTVAIFCTHGGPVKGMFQLSQSVHSWFVPGNIARKYGNGNLRHLFFQSCGALGAFKETGGGGYKSLFGEWLPGKHVAGLRTVCGIDGESVGLDRDGWRFFGRYNKGESIADSFALGTIDEGPTNVPGTVAYGVTMHEAIETLAEGRFSKERTTPKYAAASVWVTLRG